MHSDLKVMSKALQMLQRIESLLAEKGLTDGEDDGSVYASNFGTVIGDVDGANISSRLIFDVDTKNVDVESISDDDKRELVLNLMPAYSHLNCALSLDPNSQVGVTYDVVPGDWYCYLGKVDNEKPLAPEAVAFAKSVGITKVAESDEDADPTSEENAFAIMRAMASLMSEKLSKQTAAQRAAQKLRVNVAPNTGGVLN